MLDNTKELKELAEATSLKLNLNQGAIEKDFYITKAIQLLTREKDKYFSLLFQGGTSLSKGYQLIQRLSEDIDFRVILKPKALALGKEARRKKLRDFRYALVNVLRDANFIIPDDAINVLYEGRFMSIQAEFTNSEKISYLKPHIAIECFVGAPVLPPQSTSITTLIKQTIGENCNHPHFSVDCVSLDETAAEKWVALTRRIAGTQIKTRQSDKHLVRHLYDLYHLKRSDLLTGEYCNIVGEIVEKDRRQFKKHNITYTKDPLGTSELALDSLFKDNQWRAHWDSFLEQMVYDEHKPSFDDAYSSLEKLSIDIFGAIKQKA